MEKGADNNYSWYYINNQGKWEYQDGPRVLQLEQYYKTGQKKFKTKADGKPSPACPKRQKDKTTKNSLFLQILHPLPEAGQLHSLERGERAIGAGGGVVRGRAPNCFLDCN